MDTQTIYEIFRSCRLCGAGGGYKMPIIQSVVPGFDGLDVDDLRHKIRECIQLEVTHDDKMPPLICELCVDKVNDYYEFLEMAHNVNKRTRQRLGLHQSAITTPNNSDTDCILGVTEPVYAAPPSPHLVSTSAHIQPATRTQESKKPSKSSAVLAPKGRKREAPDWAPEAEDNSRNAKRTKEVVKHTTNDAGNKLKIIIKQPIEPECPRTRPRPGPKSSKQANTTPSRHKIEFEETKPARPKESKRADSERREESNVKQKGKGPHCDICGCGFKSVQGLANHQRAHSVTFTNPKAACSACGEWFESEALAILHHQWHKQTNVAYRCARCHGVFKRNLAYTQHVSSNCVPWPEVPDVTCAVCGETFVTQYLRDRHLCKDQAGRQGGQCKWCKRSYATSKTLTKHESTCSAGKKAKEDTPLASLKKKDETLSNLKKKDETLSNSKKKDETLSNSKKKDETLSNLKKKGESLSNLKKKEDISLASLKKKDESLSNLRKKVEPLSNVKKIESISLSSLKKKKASPRIPPTVRRRLLPMRVLVGRCDPLLKDGPTANVAHVPMEFGLDPSCVYPYQTARVKTERWSQDDMVRLQDNHDYREEDYIHWDSDLEGDDDEQLPRVDSLMTLALKTIFSKRCLGKVPRKLRKIQPDKNLDSLFNNIEDFSVNISSIIDTLGQDDDSDKVIRGSDTSKVITDLDKGFQFGSDSLFSEEGKVNDDKSETVSNKNIAENETDASVVGTVVTSDITSKCVNESNLDGFDIDTETNGEIKTVNGENEDSEIVIGEKIDNEKPYLDRISDEEFNFDV